LRTYNTQDIYNVCYLILDKYEKIVVTNMNHKFIILYSYCKHKFCTNMCSKHQIV